MIFKLKLKHLLFCQLIQNSLWIIALPLLSECYLFSLKVIVFGEKIQNNEHYFTYSDLQCHHCHTFALKGMSILEEEFVKLLFFKRCIYFIVKELLYIGIHTETWIAVIHMNCKVQSHKIVLEQQNLEKKVLSPRAWHHKLCLAHISQEVIC